MPKIKIVKITTFIFGNYLANLWSIDRQLFEVLCINNTQYVLISVYVVVVSARDFTCCTKFVVFMCEVG